MNQLTTPIKHIILTSHPSNYEGKYLPIQWGAMTPQQRGPVIASLSNPSQRNAIGSHSGAYMVYRALAVASGQLAPDHKPDLTNTMPTESIGPFDRWTNPHDIVSLDPLGANISQNFSAWLAEGYDIRPSIAITKARIEIPELRDSIKEGRLVPDGELLTKKGICRVTKAAIEPVWYLPGVAKRFNIEEGTLRRNLFEHTGGMFPELITRPDLEVFLPPIGGHTVYFFGDINQLGQPKSKIACRIHDECNGSDVFGSDICTCRPYLAHGIEVCIEEAQQGGLGIIVYNRKEGRALGEVTKFLVYNARKRQEGGDTASQYFARTECVAGVQDVRFQELMPDVLNWLGVSTIDRFVSMSNMKHDALINAGITIKERISIPEELIPEDAQVEIKAKQAAGYYTNELPTEDELMMTRGRGI